jgi:hypothetical protein
MSTTQLAPATRPIEPETKQARNWLTVAVLASGGVLTLAWMAFLLWALTQIVMWAIS